jgi:hypothetical protein
MPVREIADAILDGKGIKNATAKQHAGLQAGVRSSLEKPCRQDRGARRGRRAEALEAIYLVERTLPNPATLTRHVGFAYPPGHSS